MELVPNNKGGHKLLYEDYMYTKKASYKTTVRWECSQKCSKQCKGSLTTDTEMARVIRSSAHSHDGSEVTVAAIKVRTTLKDRASTSRGTPAQLRVGQVISCWSTKPFWSGDSPGMDIDQWWQTFSDPWRQCRFLRKDVSLCIGGGTYSVSISRHLAHGRNIRFCTDYLQATTLGESAVSCVYGFLSSKSQNTYEEFLQAVL